MKGEKNSSIFLRPRFYLEVNLPESIIPERIENGFKRAGKKYTTKIVDHHIFLGVPEEESHFWSPQLHIEVIKKSESHSTIKGLFGPKPQVWTLFMFIHFIIGSAFLAFGITLYVKYTLGDSFVLPLIMIIVLPLVWILLYFLGRVGKDAGKKQMEKMHALLIQSLSENS